MGQEFGRQLLNPSPGRDVRLSANGHPEYPTAGISMDWSTVAPVAQDTTLSDDTVVVAANSCLRYGQVLTKITASGKWGPYDPAANDGRQTLTRGNVCLVNVTTLFNPPLNFGGNTSNHPQVVVGGRLWRARILATDAGPHSLAAGPLFSELEAALPRMDYAQ